MKGKQLLAVGIVTAAALSLLIGCGQPNQTQGAIAGYVYKHADARNSRGQIIVMSQRALSIEYAPLPGASVLADGPTHGVGTTDTHGYFAISGLDPGNYTVEIMHPEFQGVTLPSVNVIGGETTDVGDQNLGSFHYLFIGISDYKYVTGLSYADEDARVLDDTLYTNNRFAGEARLLTNSQATRAAIFDAIESIGARVNPQDTFVMTFSGHGTEAEGHEYIVPQDASTDLATMISDSDLGQWVADHIHASVSVFIFDSCNSAGMFKTKGIPSRSFSKSTFTLMSRNLAASGYIVLTACDRYQYSCETPEFRNGVFTHFLAEGLDGMAADSNDDGIITSDEAFDYAFQKVTVWAVDNHVLQTPQIYRGSTGTARADIYRY